MSRWGDNGTWEERGLRREVFFFRSHGVGLYGSLYAAAEPSRPYGVLACNSWGVEADRAEPLLRSVALAMARLGGAGLVFHYPGYGDSFGDLADVDLADLSGAAADALAEGSRRCPDVDWLLAGFMLGASVACLAQRRLPVRRLLLVQPALHPGLYFGRLAKSRGPLVPASPGGASVRVGTTPGMAYGYPIPRRITASADEADAAVGEALAEFDGEGTVICQGEPSPPDRAPARFERVEAAGAWRFGAHNHPELSRAAVDWLDLKTRGEQR